LTEASGIPVGLPIEGANRHDMKLVADTLASVPQVVEDKRLLHLALGQAQQGLCMLISYQDALSE
jgi:putative transposase